MESILLIDKPAGVTSHDVVNMFRRKTGETCIGHAGTLDPMATGLLIILIGRTATKQQSTFLHLDKVYDCTAEIGVETDSYDKTGSVLHTAPWTERDKVTEKILQEKFSNKFRHFRPLKFVEKNYIKVRTKAKCTYMIYP